MDGQQRIGFLEMCPPPQETIGDTSELAGEDAGYIHDYVPYCAAQEAFHESMAKYRWLRGGLGSGKTRGIFEHLMIHMCMLLQGRDGIALVASQTYRHLMDNTIPVLRKAFPPPTLRGGDWDKAFVRQDMMLYLHDGKALALRTAHNGREEHWRGPEFCALVLDEGRNFKSRKPWAIGIGRLRYPGIPPGLLQAWVGSTTNGHDWMYDEFHGKYRTDKHADFLMLTKDNPHLPEGYYEDLLASLDPDEARQELFGEFIARQGAVYPTLSHIEHPEGNVIFERQNPAAATDVVIDWGYRNPRVLLVQERVGLSPESGKRLSLDAVVSEWQDQVGRPPRNRTVGDMIEWLLEQRSMGWSFRRVFCDPAGDSANDQEHITSAHQVRKALGLPIFYPKTPWQRSKVNGEKVVRARIKAANGDRCLVWTAEPDSDPTAPEIHASNSFEAHRALMFPEDRDGRAQKDVSNKDGVSDHDTDALRYRMVMLYGRETMSAAERMRAMRSAA